MGKSGDVASVLNRREIWIVAVKQDQDISVVAFISTLVLNPHSALSPYLHIIPAPGQYPFSMFAGNYRT